MCTCDDVRDYAGRTRCSQGSGQGHGSGEGEMHTQAKQGCRCAMATTDHAHSKDSA
jgi:hypothetical protein